MFSFWKEKNNLIRKKNHSPPPGIKCSAPKAKQVGWQEVDFELLPALSTLALRTQTFTPLSTQKLYHILINCQV